TVTYVVNIVNSGAIPFTGLTLTDDLGAYPLGTGTVTPLTYKTDSIRYFVNGILQAAPTVADESPLRVTGINVPADSNAAIVYETTVNNFAPLAADSEITNTVTINGNSLTAPITAEETISVEETPNLSVFKTLTPTSVTENGTVTYTITIQNTGNTAAAASSNLYITDTFNPALSNISVTLNGAPLSVPSYTYNEATGVFTTAPNVISIPAATYTQNPTTGVWTVTPGTAVITVTGTI
ncbi:MAG: hypothetical protein K2G87_10570, partial [Oscillospiraceae bacterium]|nr:hypothetical protein [Oscillospiraceae bacterium]